MGSILTNGVFLPAEGERNCYEGLAANWVALDGMIGGYSTHAADLTIHVTAADKEAWNGKADASALTAHTGNTTIHVTAADKEAWNGKADASALTAHTGDTTIHVTAADKQTWDAVTSKANDADVLHKSGDETIQGAKTFSTFITSDGSSTGDEYSSNASTNLWLMAKRDTDELSGVLFDTYRQNTAQGTGIHILGLGIKENSVRYEGCRFGWYWYNDLNGYSFDFKPTTQGANQALKHNLGTSTDKWDTINGINPGVLSMPNLSAGVDISGYITTGSTTQTYTPPANGWISLGGASKSQSAIYVWDASTGWGTSSRAISNDTYNYLSVLSIPVLAGTPITIDLRAVTTLVWAKFYPCQGNV